MASNIHDKWHEEAFLQNRYTRAYKRLIESARSCPRQKRWHDLHHIVPKSFYRSYTKSGWLDGDHNDPNNLVLLTRREHVHCHILLALRMTEGIAKHKMSRPIERMLAALRKSEKSLRLSSRLIYSIRRCQSDEKLDKEVRRWANLDGREFVGTRWQLEESCGYPLAALIALTRNVQKKHTIRGWFIIPDNQDVDERLAEVRVLMKRRSTARRPPRDTTVRTWRHNDGQTFVGTRRELEDHCGYPALTLKSLTKKSSPRKISFGWSIVG